MGWIWCYKMKECERSDGMKVEVVHSLGGSQWCRSDRGVAVVMALWQKGGRWLVVELC